MRPSYYGSRPVGRPRSYEAISRTEPAYHIPKDPAMLASWLVRKMKAKGWTQTRLAEELGCTQALVSQWMNKRVLPSRAAYDALARVFDVEKEDLMERQTDVIIDAKTDRVRDALSVILFEGPAMVDLAISTVEAMADWARLRQAERVKQKEEAEKKAKLDSML